MLRPIVTKLLLSGSSTSAQSHTAVVDTLGYDAVTIGLNFSTVTNTNGEITIKVGEGDTTSSFSDVTPLVGGGTGGFTIPGAPTATTSAMDLQLDIDCRTRKRYLLLTVTPFTTKTITSWAVLKAGEIMSQSASNEGLLGHFAG